MLIVAQNDILCPAKYAKVAAATIPNAELVLLPDTGHFDLYAGRNRSGDSRKAELQNDVASKMILLLQGTLSLKQFDIVVAMRHAS